MTRNRYSMGAQFPAKLAVSVLIVLLTVFSLASLPRAGVLVTANGNREASQLVEAKLDIQISSAAAPRLERQSSLDAQHPKIDKPSEKAEGLALDAKALPADFRGANPKATVATIKGVLDQIPLKIDKYSTPKDKSQFARIADERLKTLRILPFIYDDCSKSYNSTRQSFEFRLHRFSTFKLSGLFQHTGVDGQSMVLSEENQSSEKYEASNAYGVKRTVTRTRKTQITLAYRRDGVTGMGEPKVFVANRNKGLFHDFVVPISSDEARESDKHVRCLILFRPIAPYLADYKRNISPTINSPNDVEIIGTALIGVFEQVWVFNQRTGKIYAKFK